MFQCNYKLACGLFGGYVKHISTGYCKPKYAQVTTRHGKLRGLEKTLRDGSSYYSFKGIPYAQPPIGKLRFKAPLPPVPWQGIYEAIEHGPVCPQKETNLEKYKKQSEDCLYLNIYTKSLGRNSKLPVMVFIHGGAYISGSGNADLHGPEFLLQHDVILVTFNYRLEALGFLCLDTPEIPGNAGMKDQVAALRWVQENIDVFGGDANNVTIFGESAGATSVTYHLLSNMSKGLFHKAIAQSGVCITDWAQGKHGRERAIRAAKYLGKETDKSEELMDLLQNASVNNLVRITFKSMAEDEKYRFPSHFAPVVEKEFENVEAFLTEKPVELLSSGKINTVPLIAGYNSAEGLLITKYQLQKVPFMNDNLHYYVPREITDNVSKDTLVDFGQRIEKFYARDRRMRENDVDIIEKLHSDIHFVYNCHRFCRFYSTFCKSIYTYRFDCVTDLNIFKKTLGFKDYKGVSHVDELFYLFNNEMSADFYEQQEKLKDVVFMVTKLWTDFAKTGNPTPDNVEKVKWLPYTPRGKEFLILNESPSTGVFAEEERVMFWNSLYKEANLPHISNY